MATQEDVPVSSVTAIFANAAWYEREIREMFGVSFEGHPDLRRLLTSDEMMFFPLRKTFSVSGKVRLVYDEAKGKCVYVPCAEQRKMSDIRLDREKS